jgi:hypothetical protein
MREKSSSFVTDSTDFDEIPQTLASPGAFGLSDFISHSNQTFIALFSTQ